MHSQPWGARANHQQYLRTKAMTMIGKARPRLGLPTAQQVKLTRMPLGSSTATSRVVVAPPSVTTPARPRVTFTSKAKPPASPEPAPQSGTQHNMEHP